MEKFPDLIDPASLGTRSRSPSPYKAPPSHANGGPHPPPQAANRWLPVRDTHPLAHAHAHANGRGHSRQKSLGDAFRNIRARNGSISQDAQEIAEALRAPISPKLIILCIMWYTSSALTNTSSKSILNAFAMPATLTLVQFMFVSSLCIFMAKLAVVFPVLRTKITALKYPIRKPSREVFQTVLPLAAFQIGGHLLSSTATSKIPVSLVHTIKGLSPLFTVFAYRVVYDIRYPKATYFSLIPLTLGVMLACSGKAKYGGELIGVLHALFATIIFVTQNIYSKKLFNEAQKAEAEGQIAQSKKLDKLNLLCYSSGMAFLLTLPIWFWSEGLALIKNVINEGSVDLSGKPDAMDHGRLTVEFIFNGVTHFAQNILAFVLLSMVTPVTYSVASLIKRVFVILMAILWFRNPTTPMQAVGIGLTVLGLYLYDRTSESNKADRKVQMMAQTKTPILPITTTNLRQSPLAMSPHSGQNSGHPYREAFSGELSDDSKKMDPEMRGRRGSNGGWLPPGTKQEDTWRMGDRAAGVA